MVWGGGMICCRPMQSLTGKKKKGNGPLNGHSGAESAPDTRTAKTQRPEIAAKTGLRPNVHRSQVPINGLAANRRLRHDSILAFLFLIQDRRPMM